MGKKWLIRLVRINSEKRLWISNGEELIAIGKTARTEAREGKTYETGIGLNLDLNRISTVTSRTLKEIESIVLEFTTRPLTNQFKYEEESKVCNILIFDTETTTTGKSAELCQLSATDQSSMHQFSTYVLPEQDIDYFASRVNKLKIFNINGERRLSKITRKCLLYPCRRLCWNFYPSFHSQWTKPSPKLTKTSTRSCLVTTRQSLTLLYF